MPNQLIPANTEKLKELYAKATPIPWNFRDGHSREGDSIEVLCAEVGEAGPDEEPEYAQVLFDTETLGDSQVAINWELVKELANSGPALLSELAALRRDVRLLNNDLARLEQLASRSSSGEDLSQPYAGKLVESETTDRTASSGESSEGAVSEVSEVDVAEIIAILAHFGQDYAPGVIYLHHPANVMAEVEEPYKAVAWLHDVLEDSKFTEGHLLAAGIDRPTVEAVRILTRDKKLETYGEYIYRLADSKNQAALTVKLADLRCNLRVNCPDRLAVRYRRAIPIIEAALAALTASKAPSDNA